MSVLLTTKALKEMPENALIEYRCNEDGTVWYEPLKQVLEGAPLHPQDPSASHWCPYCDGHVWPVGYLVATEPRRG